MAALSADSMRAVVIQPHHEIVFEGDHHAVVALAPRCVTLSPRR